MSNVTISAATVKELREKTGSGLMDCKKALIETQGNIAEAIDYLRKKGLSAAEKKSNRVAAEGLIAAKIQGSIGAIIEINSETDFVAKNEHFKKLVEDVVEQAIKYNNLEELKASVLPNGKNVNEEVIENIAKIGENLVLRRMHAIKISEGIIGSYVHHGKIGVLVSLESSAKDKTALEKLAKNIAMHITASNPSSLDETGVDPKIIERERKIFSEQSANSGKPANIIEKMVEGRIRKFFSEVVLLKQNSIHNEKLTIEEVVAEASKELGAPIKITEFVRYQLGDGIEQEEKNFADEVASIAKS